MTDTKTVILNQSERNTCERPITAVSIVKILKSASNLNGNLNCSKELEHYAS